MTLALWIGVFAVSVIVLVLSADWFTGGAEDLGLHLGMAPYVVGMTIVAIGTSLPELVSSLVAVSAGSPEIVAGNVVGSNLTNIFLVLGVGAILGKRLTVSHEIINVDLPMLIASAALLAASVWDGTVSRFEGVLLVLGAVIYLLYAVSISRQRGRLHDRVERELEEQHHVATSKLSPMVWVKLVGGSVLLYFSATYTVRSVIELSSMLGVGADVIALSAVALGTSLPELVVSVVAARRGNLEVAMGNVLGSSIFNSFAVLGIPALLVPLPVESSVLTLGVPMMIIASLLFFFMAQDREITLWEGWLLVLFYGLFLGELLGIA